MKKASTFLFIILLGGPTQDSAHATDELSANPGGVSAKKKQNKGLVDITVPDRELSSLRSLLSAGKLDSAEKMVTNRLAEAPADASLRVQMAYILLARNQAAEAIRELNRAQTLNPYEPGMLEGFGLAHLAVGDSETAENKLAAAWKANGLSLEAAIKYSDFLLAKGKLSAAAQLLMEMEDRFPPSAEKFQAAARVFERLGDRRSAEIALRRSIQMQKNSPENWMAYGEYLSRQPSRISDAIDAFEGASNLAPEESKFYLKLAHAQEQVGLLEEATDSLRKAVQVAPGQDESMYRFLALQEKRGHIGAAAALLKHWNSSYPQKPWIAQSYARILSAIDQNNLAREVLVKALRENPGSEEVTQQLAALDNEPSPVSAVASVVPATAEAKPATISRTPASVAEDFEYYVVQWGDVLGTISTKFYGTSRFWQQIFDANRAVISNPEALEVGVRIRIPRLHKKATWVDQVISFAAAPAEYKAPPAKAQRLPYIVKPAPRVPEEKASEPEEILAEEVKEAARPSGRGLGVAIGVGPILQNVDLTGTGFAAALPARLGARISGEGKYALSEQPFHALLKGEYSTVTIDGYAAVLPAEIKVNEWRASALLGWEPSTSLGMEGLSLRLGYSIRQRTADRTSPRQLVTGANQAGLVAGAGWQGNLAGLGAWELYGEFYHPFSFNEEAVTTGNFESGFGVEAGGSIAFPITEKIRGSVGLAGRLERFNFSGVGTRGSVDAQERGWSIHLPIMVRF